MKRDWFFKDETSLCNVRTVGVLIRNDKILLQREAGGNEYALPGGHVKSDETSQQSLIREYKEETNANIICERLIWVEECFWKWGNKDASTIAFYYLIKLADNSDIPDNYCEPQKDNCNVIIEWVPIENLRNLIVYPKFLVEKAPAISNVTEHFVSYE